MGYYTSYQMEQVKNNVPEIIGYISGNEPYNYVFEESCKWYDHEDDMTKLSEKFPFTVFKLDGEGEEASDIWVKYYHGGKKVFEDRIDIKLKELDLSTIPDYIPPPKDIFQLGRDW